MNRKNKYEYLSHRKPLAHPQAIGLAPPVDFAILAKPKPKAKSHTKRELKSRLKPAVKAAIVEIPAVAKPMEEMDMGKCVCGHGLYLMRWHWNRSILTCNQGNCPRFRNPLPTFLFRDENGMVWPSYREAFNVGYRPSKKTMLQNELDVKDVEGIL